MRMSPRRLTRTRIVKNAVLGKVNWDEFHQRLEERAKTNPTLALGSEGAIRRNLERLSLLFWIHGTVLEQGMEEHWEERRRNADLLLSALPGMNNTAQNLIREEAWIETRFQVCGTGRHTAKDVGAGSIDYISRLQRLVEILNELKPTLMRVNERRKPRIDDDENLLLYLMAAYWKLESSLKFQVDLAAAAIHREITTLVNAWGDSLVSGVDDLDEKEIGRRIDRFRTRNQEVAALIGSNPPKFILHFLDNSICGGLRPDEPSPTSPAN
jgi:hypothetical protein